MIIGGFVFGVIIGSLTNIIGEKNVLFAPFISKNDHFTKTGSGQT
jgi:hypothetical protein